jgi:chorismate mutase
MVCSNIANFWTIGDCANKQVINISSSKVTSITQNINTFMSAKTDSNVVTSQSQTVIITGNPPVGINTNITQSAVINFVSNTTSKMDAVTQTVNKLQTELTNSLKQRMEQTLGVFAAGSKAGDQYTNISQKIAEILNTNINNNQIYDQVNNIISIQEQKITIAYSPVSAEVLNNTLIKNGTLDINQTTVIDAQVQTTIEMVSNILSQNESLVKMLNDVRQDLTQEVKGIDTITGQLFDFLKTYAYIIGLVLVALIIGGVAIWYFFLRDPENVKTLSGAAVEVSKNVGGPKGMKGKL